MKKYSINKGKSISIHGTNGQVNAFAISYADAYISRQEKTGYIESERNLAQEGGCMILNDASCIENASVSGSARILGSSIIKGSSLVYGQAQIGTDEYDDDYEDYPKAAIISGNSQISGEACIPEGIVLNSTISGNSYISTHKKSDYGEPVGIISCSLSGNAHIDQAHLIANIQSEANLIFSAGAQVIGNDDYFFMETMGTSICVHRRSDGIFCLIYNHSGCDYPIGGDIQWKRFSSEPPEENIPNIDAPIRSMILEKIRNTLMKKFSYIHNGIHYRFELLNKGTTYGNHKECTASSDDTVVIHKDEILLQPLDIELFKSKSGVASLEIPPLVLDKAIKALSEK